MRPQDEIKVALPRQPEQGRNFLLRRLAQLPLTEDGPQFLSLVSKLQGQGSSLSAALCEDALWRKIELERMHRSVGEESGQGGTWSAILQGGPKSAPVTGIRDASLAAGQKLEELLPALAEGATRGEAEAAAVTRALGSIQSRRSIEHLEKIAFDQGAILEVMVAYSRLGGELAATKAMGLVEAVQGTAVHPQLLGAFANLPSKATFEFLLKQLKIGNAAVAMGVAVALEGFHSFDALRVLDALVKVPDPWVLINVVETLGRIGGDEYLERIERIYERHGHALIRISCLQAVAGSTGKIAFHLAQRGLGSKDPSIQAAAIEAMVTTGVPSQNYRDTVLPMMNSPHAKLALNACLACMAFDARRAVQHVTGLISCGDPAKLLQSIHCLAYVEAPVAYQALGRIIKMCPPGVMRLEAIKSLGRLASRRAEAAHELLPSLVLEDPPAQELTAYFLGDAHPEAQVPAAKALSHIVREFPESPLALTCLHSLGLLGPAGQLFVPDLHHALLKGPEQARAAATALVTSFPRSKEAQSFGESNTPLVRAFHGLNRWYAEGSGLDDMERGLRDPAGFVFRTSCELVRRAGTAGGWTQDTRRLVGLAKNLGAATLDAEEVDGLGRLDQSLSIPRKKIGLGIVPSAAPGASTLDVASLLPEANSLAEAHRTSEIALLAQSVYETTDAPSLDPQASAVAPRRTGPGSGGPAQPGPANQSASTSAPGEEGGKPLPTTTLPLPGGRTSRTQEALRWLGLLVLCVAAVFLGRALKTWLGP